VLRASQKLPERVAAPSAMLVRDMTHAMCKLLQISIDIGTVDPYSDLESYLYSLGGPDSTKRTTGAAGGSAAHEYFGRRPHESRPRRQGVRQLSYAQCRSVGS
jgi:hypothetical protein